MASTPKNQKKKSTKQVDRFREAARELEADEDERAFERKLKRIANQKPKKEAPDD